MEAKGLVPIKQYLDFNSLCEEAPLHFAAKGILESQGLIPLDHKYIARYRRDGYECKVNGIYTKESLHYLAANVDTVCVKETETECIYQHYDLSFLINKSTAMSREIIKYHVGERRASLTPNCGPLTALLWGSGDWVGTNAAYRFNKSIHSLFESEDKLEIKIVEFKSGRHIQGNREWSYIRKIDKF